VVAPGARVNDSGADDSALRIADGSLVGTWREDCPWAERMSREEYDDAKRVLQVKPHSGSRIQVAVPQWYLKGATRCARAAGITVL